MGSDSRTGGRGMLTPCGEVKEMKSSRVILIPGMIQIIIKIY